MLAGATKPPTRSERNFDSSEFEDSKIRCRIGESYLKYSNIDIEYSNIWHICRTRIVLLGLEYSKFRSLKLRDFVAILLV